MIVLNVTYKCKPDRREEFLEMIYAEGIDEACRAEDGNMKYDYYTPLTEATTCSWSRSGVMPMHWPLTESSRILQGWEN